MLCFPCPSPTFHVPWPCDCFHAWRGQEREGHGGHALPCWRQDPSTAPAGDCFTCSPTEGRFGNVLGTEQIHNKTHLWLTEFQAETQLSSMDPWSCQMVIMRKSAGNTSFLWLLNSSCACFSVLAFVNSQSTNVLGIFCTVCGQWQIYIQHWVVISIFSFFLGIVCTGKAKQQASLR